MLCSISFAFSQNVELIQNETRATTYQGKSYLVVQSLTIQPPPGGGTFSVNAAANGAFFIKMADASTVIENTNPSKARNFIGTETILKSGITNENQIPPLGVTDKSVKFNYFDGVNRPIQEVAMQMSPMKKDVVIPYSYDTDGWQTKSYMPFSTSIQDGSFHSSALPEQSTFYSSAPKVAADARPFSEQTIEKSALGRVTEIYNPGNLWKTNLKNSTSKFGINDAATIKLWTISAGLPATSTFYAAGSLAISTSTNEDGYITKVYQDQRGQAVQKDINGLTTCFIYDDFGNLRFVLPPKISGVAAPSQAQLDAWAFQYQYDARLRVIKQKNPGVDWVYTIYDNWDRPVASQDGNQRNKPTKEWTYIKYDEFNRPIIKGIFTSANTYDQMLLAIAGTHHEDILNTSSIGYTFASTFPTPAAFPSVTEANMHIINYYDDYRFLSIAGWDAESNAYAFNNPPGFSNVNLTAMMGEMTGSKTKVLDGSGKWLNSVVHFDKRYRAIQSIRENNLSGTDQVTIAYNFPGWATKSQRLHNTSIGSVTILEEFEYDHAGRVAKTYHTLDNGPRVLLTSNNYNELGQLVESNLHSTDNGMSYLQSVDYRYNIRGWLSHINNSTLSIDANNDDANDLFGMQFIFNDQNPVVNGTTTNSQYSGNLAAVKWKADNKKVAPKERIYGYNYDTRNRLNSGLFAATNGSTWTDEGGFYDESSIAYDDNGNIKWLSRFAKIAGARGALDVLIYNNNGTTSVDNTLLTVEDGGNPNLGFINGTNGQITEYQFDKNGNLTSDLNAALTQVTYNLFDLPEKVVYNGGAANETSVEFTYDASGYLLRKVYKKMTTLGPIVESQIDYVKGIQYYNNALALVFTPKGRASKYNGNWEYEYFLADHLGNNRLIFGYLHDADVYRASMESFYAAKEQSDFKKILETRWTDPANNHTAKSTDVPVPDKSALLNGSVPGLEVGPGKMLNITSGDKLKMEVYARYNSASGSASDVVASLVSAATTSLNITAGENPAAYGGFNTYLPGFTNGISYNTGDPKAYLNYILFDANYANPQFGYAVIPSTAANKWEKLSVQVTAPVTGYIYIYVTNESNYNVFFDDLLIIHEKNTKSLRVTESADYYPFGLMIEGTHYIDESRLVNSYGYQGMYSEFDARTGWNRFEGRGNYDSRLGRWMSADPLANATPDYSPYAAMMNNPALRVDPDGRFLPAVVVGAALLGGAANLYQNWDKIRNPLQGVNYFLTGAASGALVFVSPLVAASVLTGGNIANNLINGVPIDLQNSASEFVFTFVGGKATQKSADATLKITNEAKKALENCQTCWRYWYKVTAVTDDFLKQNGLNRAEALPILEKHAELITNGFKIEGQLTQIFSDKRLFSNWLKGNHSLSRIGSPLNSTQAQQIIDNARKLGLSIESNLKGLQGLEITGQWGGIPHFKVGNVHIPIEQGLENILKF